MADLRNVIGLLYRADWTRLSLSAGVRFERDGDLAQSRVHAMRPPGFRPGPVMRLRPDPDGGPPILEEVPEEERGGHYSGRATLLIAPGRRYRLEHLDERAGYVEGSDGDHGWIWWHQAHPSPPSPMLIDVAHEPPLPELFWPSGLLSGFNLEVREPVTVGGRDAIAVAATPRRDAIGSRPSLRDHFYDRVEVIVDAELGIVLRREETFGGQRLTLTELTAVTLSPPEAADPARFAPPPGSRISQGLGESLRDTFGGPSWQTAKNAAGLAAGGLGALIRFAPNLAGPDSAGENDPEAAMPSPEPGPHDPPGPPPASGDLPYLLYRSGQAPDFRATLHQWHDLAAMVARVPETARAAGHGGVGYLLDAATRGKTVTHTVARLRVSGRDRYRIDYQSRSGRTNPKTVACDGEHRWQVYQAKTMVGAAAPPPHDIANLIDSSWLFGCRLSGGSEITYHGRRAYQLRVTPSHGGQAPGPLMFFPADVIVDAETGCLLRLISYAGERPASWWELRDFAAEPGGPGDFRLDVPPGVRVVEETGKPIDDAAAVMPGMSGYAVRTAADVVRRTAGAVSATRSFLDDLRGRSRPPA
jgi:outer membrane lipoprotein-sorting protein